MPPFFPRVFMSLIFFCVHFWAVFRHMVFHHGFLFPIKELGLLTNPGHWIRVLDMPLAPICILYCKQCMICE
jgi:hypothetical protein